ncbi:unnamed protein product [Moneuplotes crassus]|uniref:Tyrosine-protein phosphatase domain-containing protein n=1 Tax=Euplotes crassus TaxID=5936 RepID=A0AAD1Y0C2_EUPCR|nr:unnamed protein product [Moneuplotes crassus]
MKPQGTFTIVGAVKIIDGLFLGDEFAAQDLEFLISNKVNNVINCCGGQIDNLWVNIGINYLTFNWSQECVETILDPNDVVMQQIYPYIEECVSNSESILVHSVTGMNRSVLVISAYLMKKYHWSLKKSLEFIKTRKPSLEIKSEILEQLVHYEAFLHSNVIKNPSFHWNEDRYEPKNIVEKLSTVDNLQNEEFMLRNTYLNSLAAAQVTDKKKGLKKKHTVKWQDKGLNIKAQLEEVHEKIEPSSETKVYPVTAHIGITSDNLKSAIKSETPPPIKTEMKKIQEKPKVKKTLKEEQKSITLNTFEMEEDSKESSSSAQNPKNLDTVGPEAKKQLEKDDPLNEVISLDTLNEYSDISNKNSQVVNTPNENVSKIPAVQNFLEEKPAVEVNKVDFHQKVHKPTSPKLSQKNRVKDDLDSGIYNALAKEPKINTSSKEQIKHQKQLSESSFRIKEKKKKSLNYKMRRDKQSHNPAYSHDYESKLNLSEQESGPYQKKDISVKDLKNSQSQDAKGTIIFNPTIINSITIGVLPNGNQAVQNTQEPSRIVKTTGLQSEGKILKKNRHKMNRLPSARTAKDTHFFVPQTKLPTARASNSLKRKRKMFESKESLKNDKRASESRAENKETLNRKIIKSKRQYSLNSINIKSQRFGGKAPPEMENQNKGHSWFNYQQKSREKLINIKNFKNNMIFRRNGTTPTYKTKITFNRQGSGSQKRFSKPRVNSGTQYSKWKNNLGGSFPAKKTQKKTFTNMIGEKHRPFSASQFKRNVSSRPRDRSEDVHKRIPGERQKRMNARKPGSARIKDNRGQPRVQVFSLGHIKK